MFYFHLYLNNSPTGSSFAYWWDVSGRNYAGIYACGGEAYVAYYRGSLFTNFTSHVDNARIEGNLTGAYWNSKPLDIMGIFAYIDYSDSEWRTKFNLSSPQYTSISICYSAIKHYDLYIIKGFLM